MPPESTIESYGLLPGRILARKYEVISLLGDGWEGEVYRIRELGTGIERTAKFFFPERNPRDRAIRAYAARLHTLRNCPIVIQYHTRETIPYRGRNITFLVSEFVEGDLLKSFLARLPGRRLSPFAALHFLYALARGMEYVHNIGEYHGDLHPDNVIVERAGLRFDLKLVDLYQRSGRRQENIAADVIDMITVFHYVMGGARTYARHPRSIKEICCGLRHRLILEKFRTAGQLRQYLESLEWDS
jgi:serine/threonine protein kinase